MLFNDKKTNTTWKSNTKTLSVLSKKSFLFLGPHSVTLSIAAVDGTRRWTCLSPAEFQRDEFSASRQQREAQGSPKGRDSGVPFLCSFLGKQKEHIKKHYIIFYVHFLCLPKENEPKEKVADHLAPHFMRDYPAQLEKAGRCETRRLKRLRQSSR
jgi:hypothetical protein